MTHANPDCVVEDLGITRIPEVDEYMRNLRQQRLSDLIEDRLLMLAHPPCLAVGARRLNPADLLKPKDEFEKADIPLYQSSRGGGLTFHWPGQLVVYPVLKLAKSEQSLPKFMHRLEEVGLRTLSELGIAAYRRRHEAAQIGLWHEGRKIASMGIFVARWITSFGFALNLSGDTRPARYIRPCGLKGVQLITIEEINGQSPDRKQVKKLVLRHFQEVFERKLISA